MGDYPRNCERSVGEMAAAEATEISGEIFKMRAVEEEKDEVTSSTKRRKVDDCDEEPELQLNLPANTVSASTADSTTTSSATDLHKEKMRSTDLAHKDSETEISTFIIGQFSRETSPSSEICGGDSEGEFMESISSTTTKKEEPSPRNSQELKTKTCTPSAAEIEEFFAAAEKREQKKFAEKYNYDIVKDMPLEGRYEWIRLKP